MTKVAWGVIGAGGIADRRTIPEGILPARNAKLAAVMDIDVNRAVSVARKYGVPGYSRVSDLLADEGIEAVYIATPTFRHKTQIVQSAKAGKHVLCEKPLTLTAKEAETAVKACDEAGVKLGIGFMMRYNVYHRKLRAMVQNGDLGTVVFARAQLTCWYPPIAGAWRQDPKLGGGGALMDLSVHCIDVLEFILGPVREVTGYVESLVHPYPSDDANAVLLAFESGTIGFIDCAFNIPDDASENVLELQGTKGCIKARMTISQGPGGEVRHCLVKAAGGYDAAQRRSAASYRPLSLKPRNTYRAEIEAFSHAILTDTEPPIDGAVGLHSMRVVEAIRRADRTGKTQPVGA